MNGYIKIMLFICLDDTFVVCISVYTYTCVYIYTQHVLLRI